MWTEASILTYFEFHQGKISTIIKHSEKSFCNEIYNYNCHKFEVIKLY